MSKFYMMAKFHGHGLLHSKVMAKNVICSVNSGATLRSIVALVLQFPLIFNYNDTLLLRGRCPSVKKQNVLKNWENFLEVILQVKI